MTATGVSAEATARRAAHSNTFKRLVKAGLIAFGATHILIAWLALQIALGHSPASGDQAGAFATVAKGPGGKFLVVLIAIALAALALWQLFEAAMGHTELSGRRRTLERVGSGFRTVIYAALAWTSARTGMSGPQSSGNQQQSTTAHLMASGGGRFLVGLVGLAIACVGVGLIWYGWKEKFLRNLYACPHSVKLLAKFGYPAKGVAFGLAGALMLAAAITYDPGKARGLDGALRTIATQPFGRFLLILVALGIAAYGIYCFAQSKYRKI